MSRTGAQVAVIRRLAGLLAALGLLLSAQAGAAVARRAVRPFAAAAGAAGRQGDSSVSANEASSTAAEQIELTINPFAPGQPVPPRFLGLSFEAAALPQLASYEDRGDLVAMLRSLGPGVLRFGGITADENVGWSDAGTPAPAWASSVIDPADLRALGRLARLSGWRVLLTVGLAHDEPQAAASEVAAAHHALGSYLAAVEIGNEPEAYARHGYRESPWLPQIYEEEVSEYRDAIDALTPGVPLAGPDSSGSGSFLEWGFADALAQAPSLLTGHHYPLGCAQTPPPSIALLLSAATRGREAASLEAYLSIARSNRIPLRIDEAGSVSCGGVAGISDTFASALWAAGYIGQNMAAGTAGINLQGNPANCVGYTPLCGAGPAALAAGALQAQPAWYALLLTRSLIGYRPLPTTIEASPVPNLAATAFSGPGHTLKLLLSDDEAAGAMPLALHLTVGPGRGPAQVLRLTGPSLGATGGVRLAGLSVPADGVWRAPRRPETKAVRSGVLSIELAPSSAALVTVGPAPVKHRHRRRRG